MKRRDMHLKVGDIVRYIESEFSPCCTVGSLLRITDVQARDGTYTAQLVLGHQMVFGKEMMCFPGELEEINAPE